MDATTRVARPLLAFRKAELPAREVSFEELVADIKRAAASVYMVGIALEHLGEESGGSAAVVLSEVIRRRCEALERLAEQREG